MRKFLLTLFSVLVCSMMFAASTVYYVIPATTVGSYAVKVNVNMQGDGDTWQDFVMTNTGKTYNSQTIYSATINELYGGLGAMYFKLYDGDTEKAYEKVFGNYEWTSAATYNGKMWVHGGSSWIAYAEDAAAESGSPVSKTMDALASANSWSNATAYTSFALDDVITMSTTGTTNNGKYYVSDKTWRLYQGGNGNLVLTAEDGYLITSVKVTFSISNGGKLVDSEDNTVTSGTAYELDEPAQSITFTVKNSGSATNGQVKVTAIEVAYESEGGNTPVTPDPTPTINHYLVGEGEVMKAWDASQALAMVNDTIEFKNLAAGTYKFKILDRQTWTDAVELTCNDLADGVNAGCDGSNVQFTLSKAADIVIKVVNNEIVILGIPEAAKKEIKLLNAKELAAAEATMFVHFWGEGITATTAKMTLLKEGNDTLGFSAEILEGATGCLFVRMPKDAATIDWDTNWGKTGDAVVCDSMYYQGWTGDGIFAVSCEAPLTETVFTVVVPASIDSMFIAGSFNEWSFAKMSLVEGEDSIYTLTVPGDQRGAEYKYAAGPDWSYVEVRTCDEGDCNRSYAEKDTVTAFTSVPVVVEYTTIKLLNAKALASDNAKMFVHAWGTGIAEQDVEMSILKEGNDTLGFEAEINKLAEQLVFVRMNGESEGINWEENWGKSADLDRCANDSMYYQGWTGDGIFAVSCEAPLTETVFTVVVPASIDSMFIAGSFNDWSFAKMSLVEGEDSIYTLTVPGDQRGAAYKYAAGPDWSYVEVRTCDEGDCNRSYAVKDTVKAFTSVPVVVEYTTVKLLNAKALAADNAKLFVHAWGTGIADQDVEMSILKEGNDTLGFEAEINKLAEQLVFVRMNGEADAINWEENWGKSADLDRCANDSMYYQGWTGEGIFAVSCEAPLTETVFTVVVPASIDSMFIAGSFNDWSFAKMSLVEGEDSIYTLTVPGDQRGAEYKYAAGPDWSYVEVRTCDEGDCNRSYAVKDTVKAFTSVPVVVEYTTIKLLNAKALAADNAKMFVHAWGTGIAEQDVEMSILKEGNDTLGFEAEINKLAEQLIFVRMNGESEGINWEENWGKSADLTRCANDSMYYQGWTGDGIFAVSCEAPLTETVFTVVVPASIDSMFIAGSFNDWSFAKMSLAEGEDSIYTLTVPGDQRGALYKYAAGPDWSYVEVRTCDEGDCNRSYAVKDTVKAFTSVPVVVEYTTIKLLNAKDLAAANAKMFVHAWGTGIADQDVEMSILKEGNDTLGFEAEINKLAEQLVFVRMNGEAEGINWEENWGKSADLDRCANDSMYYQGWTGEGIFAVSCEAEAPVVPAKTYYFTSAANGWSFEAFEDVEGVLTFTVDTMLATDGFKVTDAEDWTHGNWGAVDGFLTVAKGDEYQLNGIENLYLNGNYENVVLTLTIPAEGNPSIHFVSGDPIIEISSAYYVTGSMNDWSEPYALGEDKTITLPLEADTYEFKVLTAEQDWATALDFNALATVPEGVTAGDNNNIKFTLAEAGDVVISINEEGKIVLEGNFYVPVIGEKVTYYFINNMEWETVYAYAYANEGAEKNADWPGELMTLTNAACTNGAVYSIEIAEGFETIIFNNGNGGEGNQTANLAIEAGKPYFYNGVAYAALDEACEAVVEDKLYVIGNAAALGAWNINNAVEMTDGELTVTLEGGQSYSFKIVATKAWDQPGQLQWGDQADGQAKLHADGTNIAFDMPSTAEVTIKVVDGKVVVEGIPDGEIVIPDTRYIIGSDAQMGNWQIENAVLMENNQITLTLPAGTYTFKIVATKAWNQAGQLDCNNIAEDAEHLDCDGTTDNNVRFVLSEEATVTIKLVDDKIYIEGVPEIPVEKVTYYFINNMEWETVYAYAYANEGAKKNAEWPGEPMSLTNAACTNGAVYSIEIAEGFETIIFNNGNGGEGNQTANLAIEDGKPYYYNEVAYAALDDACESVEPQPVVAYYLAGDMTSWVVADMPAFVDNQVKVILSEVKTYEFKVVQTVDEAQTWLTNENAGTMTRENCTGWSFIALDGEDNNTKLNADVAGEYTFTLDLTDGVKVSVTFPNKEEGSGLEQILMNNGLEKFIYNGHFYIRRENKLYNVQGQLVR